MLHIDESLVGAHMTTKGGIQGLPFEFHIAQATMYGKAMSETPLKPYLYFSSMGWYCSPTSTSLWM